MNEAEIRRVDIGAIAVPQSLVGRGRLPSREYGSGNGASGSRERQERGRVIKPMLSLPARGFVPASGRCRPISFTSARRARRLIGDGPVLSGSIGTVVDGFELLAQHAKSPLAFSSISPQKRWNCGHMMASACLGGGQYRPSCPFGCEVRMRGCRKGFATFGMGTRESP